MTLQDILLVWQTKYMFIINQNIGVMANLILVVSVIYMGWAFPTERSPFQTVKPNLSLQFQCLNLMTNRK